MASNPSTEEALAELQRVLDAGKTPAWVRALLIVVLALVRQLQDEVSDLKSQLNASNKARFGAKSERTPRLKSEEPSDPKPPRKPRTGPSALSQAKLPEQIVDHHVRDDRRDCPACGGKLNVVMPPDETVEFELEVAKLIRRRHRRHKLACRCGCHIQTADGPDRVTEGGVFGPVLHADTMVRRTMDAIPINRMADQYARAGVPLSVSTMLDIFHAGSIALAPLRDELQIRVQNAHIVHADETPHRVLATGKCKTSFLWVFSSADTVLMIHAGSRSGATPSRILKDTFGVLVADGFTGFNCVVDPAGRQRQGCMAHARRKFLEALATEPEAANWMLGHIALLYKVEAYASEQNYLGTEAHLRLREEISRVVLENMRARLDELRGTTRPKSPLGKALGYLHNQWSRLCLFLEDPEIPIDNNEAERQLRRPVLGRKTSLFVGSDESGERYAVVYSLVMTCVKIGVNPTEYLAWVLPKVQGYSGKRMAELLPHAYQRMISTQADDEPDAGRLLGCNA